MEKAGRWFGGRKMGEGILERGGDVQQGGWDGGRNIWEGGGDVGGKR